MSQTNHGYDSSVNSRTVFEMGNITVHGLIPGANEWHSGLSFIYCGQAKNSDDEW